MVIRRVVFLKTFFDLYNADFDLSEIVAINQHWQTDNTFSMKYPRPNNALLYFLGCSGKYKQKGEEECREIPKGSIFFVPEGALYDWTFCDVEHDSVATFLFEFALTSPSDGRIRIDEAGIVGHENDGVRALFSKLIHDFSRPRPIPARLKASAYELISHILDSQRKSTIKKSFECIYKGIKYLEDDPKQEKSIEEISEMCNISVNYFERLFKEYSGMSPTSYRIKRKLERARVLLLVGDMTVQQVSYELGFYDTAYFCRVFKKAFGMTPTEVRK
ncbi:MAG: helix-turn-helix transcriptional regulator [Ruminococcaceae bacterium]|nr:helix-turn-helix transcriptional regulator [Oscillospiraceae bacterium]